MGQTTNLSWCRISEPSTVILRISGFKSRSKRITWTASWTFKRTCYPCNGIFSGAWGWKNGKSHRLPQNLKKKKMDSTPFQEREVTCFFCSDAFVWLLSETRWGCPFVQTKCFSGNVPKFSCFFNPKPDFCGCFLRCLKHGVTLRSGMGDPSSLHPPKTNMEPENGGPLEKEIQMDRNHHFQGSMLNFREGTSKFSKIHRDTFECFETPHLPK